MVNWILPDRNDYSIFKTNQSKTVYYFIEFKNLKFSDKSKNSFEVLKNRSGCYAIQLFYRDAFQRHPLAIGFAKSNKIVFNYIE